MRPFRVVIPTGHGGTSNSTGRALNPSRFEAKYNIVRGRMVRKRPVANSVLWSCSDATVTTKRDAIHDSTVTSAQEVRCAAGARHYAAALMDERNAQRVK
jgi:hypothetical protein